MENLQKIAVLIDADNTQLSKMEALLHEVSTYGRIVLKKAYGNWKKPALKNWENEVKRLAIKAEQQFDYVAGKNTTDIALSIDAMDLLHERTYDAFVLVSSDSDYTPLAIRLRESGAYIIGAGVTTTPESFKNACDDFILLEYVSQAEEGEPAEKPAPEATASGQRQTDRRGSKQTPPAPHIEEIHNLLRIAWDRFQDDEGFVNVASAGHYLKRAKPDFNCKTYGYAKLSELLTAFPQKYQVERKVRGSGTAVYYKCR
ncbi:MAG: NYN domain-containing protein [Clostridiales bacterium]|nr:NYN domain-containing protein [Clostridiales bacterium]